MCVYIGFKKNIWHCIKVNHSAREEKKHLKRNHVNLLPSQSISPINIVKKKLTLNWNISNMQKSFENSQRQEIECDEMHSLGCAGLVWREGG